MPDAMGIYSKLRAGFQTDYYTAAPADTYFNMPFDSDALTGKAPLGDNPSLGYGRDGVDPFLDALDTTGDIVVGLEPRSFGIWLKAFHGGPVSSTATHAANGKFAFRSQPAAGSKIKLNGVEWTFVASGAAGLQSNIGVNLAATLTALATALNASANAEISKCTYSATATSLDVVFDTLGKAGNTYTIAAEKATNARVTALTLKGGGYTHVFHSGGVNLPWMTLEVANPEVASYRVRLGAMINQIQMGQTRMGRLVATMGLIAQTELLPALTSICGSSITDMGYDEWLVQKMGDIRIDGELAADVTASDITFSNNLEVKAGLRGDGSIGGCVPAEFTSQGNVTTRFVDDEFLWKARQQIPMSITRRWAARAGVSLAITQHRVFLPLAGVPVSGKQSLEVSFASQAARDPVLGRKQTIELVNDIESYA